MEIKRIEKYITFSDFRTNLESTLDRITDNDEPLLVKRQEGKDIVVMSLKDYNTHKETVSLLSNPANAIKLMQSIEEYKAGKAVEVDIQKLG